jgi:hypothetical protein
MAEPVPGNAEECLAAVPETIPAEVAAIRTAGSALSLPGGYSRSRAAVCFAKKLWEGKNLDEIINMPFERISLSCPIRQFLVLEKNAFSLAKQYRRLGFQHSALHKSGHLARMECRGEK